MYPCTPPLGGQLWFLQWLLSMFWQDRSIRLLLSEGNLPFLCAAFLYCACLWSLRDVDDGGSKFFMFQLWSRNVCILTLLCSWWIVRGRWMPNNILLKSVKFWLWIWPLVYPSLLSTPGHFPLEPCVEYTTMTGWPEAKLIPSS